MKNERIILLYIDDDQDEAISDYLENIYQNDQYDVSYMERKFEGEQGYESLLEYVEKVKPNVILIDSRLFENDNVKCKEKFSGEEFRILLRKLFPFIEVLVISQIGENKEYDIIPKYRSGSAESPEDYYNRYLKEKLDEMIERVITFRNISQKLKKNQGVEKVLVERTVDSLNGITDYEVLSKDDIDRLINAFREIGEE
ncbi:MAG: hypothetical protein LIO99_13470 [Clostridiales bacterium]|nr:hypothetical protein [Clostridiales bacterium]